MYVFRRKRSPPARKSASDKIDELLVKKRVSIRRIVDIAKSYRGECSHVLWEDCGFSHLVDRCFKKLSEDKLFELFQALIRDDPGFPTHQLDRRGTFLHAALMAKENHQETASTRVMLLLCAPGMTRAQGEYYEGGDMAREGYPLHRACNVRDVDPRVIHRLIDLDPDVLLLPACRHELPLHLLFGDITFPHPPVAVASRMVDVRPESLRHRNRKGETPVAVALQHCSSSPEFADLLTRLVVRCPESVLPPPRIPGHRAASSANTPLLAACENFRHYPNLIGAVIQADPSALGVACVQHWGPLLHALPFEVVGDGSDVDDDVSDVEVDDDDESDPDSGPDRAAAAAAARVLVEEETLHLALALVELHGTGGPSEADDANAAADPSDLAGAVSAFQRHVRDTVATFVPATMAEAPEVAPHPPATGPSSSLRPMPPPAPSAFAVAESIRTLDNHRRMDFCRELFRHEETHRNLRHNLPGFRSATLGDASVLGLYQLNRRDRSNPSAVHQLRLLTLVSHSTSLDCIYLQFREHAMLRLVIK